jgi:probable F420-dependent oxidoreductase
MSWNVGIVIPDPTAGGATLTGQARLIEQLGFDWICCGEHVLFSVPISNAFVTLAHIGAVTERIELLSGVTLAALYPAAQIAKMATTLDITSGGRFNLGIGVAGEYPNEFAACGIPVTERGSRTDEALQIVCQLWTGDFVDFEGRYATVKGRMRPRPIRVPPIWVGGRKEAAVRRAATYADVWFPYLVSPTQVARGHQQLQTDVAAAGRPAGAVRTMVFCFVSIDNDGDRARQVAETHVGTIYGQNMAAVADSLLVSGTPERCIERLQEYASAGADGIVVSLVGPLDAWPDRVGLFSEQVMPAIRLFEPGGS